MGRTAGAIVSIEEIVGADVRPVPSAVDHFATAEGRILSCARGGVLRERRPCVGPRGYLHLVVTREGRMVGHPVHRMVAEAFHGPRAAGQQVRHLNGQRTDNRAENLAWGSAQENIDDRDEHGTTARGVRNGYARLDEARVGEIKRRLAAGEPKAALARAFGVSWPCIDRIAREETWVHVTEAAS